MQIARLFPIVSNGKIKTLKQFKESSFEKDELWLLFNQAHSEIYSEKVRWYFAKQILKHKDCPEGIRIKYLKSKIWYHRIVAGLAKPVRENYAHMLIFDEEKKVRLAAMNCLSADLYIQAKIDKLESKGPKVLINKKKQILRNPAYLLLDPYPYVRSLAEAALK